MKLIAGSLCAAFIIGCSSPEKQSLSPAKPNDIQGVFLAKEAETGFAILTLDTKTSKGAIYSPWYGITSLANVVVDSGNVAFDCLSDQQVATDHFTGILEGIAIKGKFKKSDSAKPVILEQIFRDSGATEADYGEIYSNLYIHAETGDLLGDELIVLHTLSRPTVIITMGEGDLVGPFIGGSTSLSKDTVNFTVMNDRQHRVILDEQKAVLQRQGPDSLETTTLKRVGRVTSTFEILMSR